MASQIGINVNIKSELEKLQGFRDEAKSKGAFKGPGGPEALSRIDGLLKMIKGLTDTGQENVDDWKKIVSSVKTIYSELSQFSAKISKISPELEKLYEGLRKKEAQINEWSGKKIAGTEGRTNVGRKIKSLSETEQVSFHKITKKGNVSKGALSDPETILRNYKEGSLAISKNGQEITDKGEIDKYLKDLSAEYEKHTAEVENAKTKINELSASIEQLNTKIKNQIAKDEASGVNSGGELVAQVESSSHDFNKAANKSLEDTATTNEGTVKLDPSVNKVATQSAGGWSKAFKAFTLYSLGLRTLKTAAKSAVQTVQDLDKYLTEQAMVTGKTRKETYGLLKSYQDLATQCGATTKEIAQVATEYMKQGKTTADALVLTEAAVKAAKVAGVSVTDSVNYLTTALNGFQLAAEDAMKVSDKFAAIAAASATDYDELAIALSKVASQANLAGMSIDYTTALLTKGLETTREAPETMGTALKTIIARMRELGDYGETLDDGMDINNVESQLKYVGIALRDSNGELRSTEDVLDELGHKWDGLNKNQQAAIAKALAGTRQQARLIAMMEDYERVTELQEISQRSAGATAAQADKYLQGMEAAMNNVNVAWEKVAMAFTDSEFIIKLVNGVAGALEVVGDVLDTTAGQVGVFGTIAAIGFTVVGNKMQEHKFAKDLEKLEKEKLLRETQLAIVSKNKLVEDEKAAAQKAKSEADSLKNAKEENIAKIEQAAQDKKNDIDKNIADLQQIKNQAVLNKQKYENNILQAEARILELEQEQALKKKLLEEKKITQELYEQAAAKAEAEGDTAKADEFLNKAVQEESDYNQAKADYDAQDYDGQIKKQQDIIRGNKSHATKAQNAIDEADKNLTDATSKRDEQFKEIDSDANSKIAALDAEIAQKEEIARLNTENAAIHEQELSLLQQQQSLLESQLSPIQAIASGITGWITPFQTVIEKIKAIPGAFKEAKTMIEGVGKKFKAFKKHLDTSKINKKNEKALKKEEKARKKNEKALKKEEKATKKSVKAEQQEIKANIESATAETSEATANTASATTETAEIAANVGSTAAETAETAANVGATTAEGAETAANVASTSSEVAETISSGASAGADILEAGTSTKAAAADMTESASNTMNAITGSAESASKIPYVGWAIALGILALAGVAGVATLAIGGMTNAINGTEKSSEKRADNINNLSSEIYELTQRANDLDKIADDFQSIDDKVLKTKKDVEDMNTLLEQAADTMSDDIEEDEDIGYGKGVSARDAYEGLTREEDKIAFIKAEAQRNRDEANKKRQEQLDYFNNAKSLEKENLLHGTDSRYVNARSAIYGINNNTLYETIDGLKELEGADEDALKATEELAQAMLEELSIEDALDVANEDRQETINNLIKSLQGLEATEDFLNEDNTFLERVQAFKELEKALAGNEEMLNALKAAYSEWDAISKMDTEVLNFIDTMGLSIDEINELYAGYKDLQKAGMDITKEAYQDKLDIVMGQLNGDLSNFNTVIGDAFRDVLSTAEDFDEAWNTIVSSIGDTFATTILDMGQHMDQFNNTINSFYEKASEWGEMTESEKMEFITENQELFSGEGGQEMLQAFQSGNYELIESALSKQMAERTQQQLEEVRRTLAIEEARVGEDRNEAYIASLKEYEEYLLDGDDLYKASLELRLEQEEKQLDKYREYLEEQQEALTESLEKRKEAYEKYFESINQEEEDEDYEEQADQLISNLSKLGSSTDASSIKQTKELEKQLEDLEEERLKELRERAQEAVLENMDKEVEEINEKFDKLLESNQALLAAMKGELEDPAQYLSNLISTQVENGATAAQLEDYIGGLQSSYGNILGGADLEDISVREENNQLFLTVNGKEVALDTTNEQNLFTAIMKALREVGVR